MERGKERWGRWGRSIEVEKRGGEGSGGEKEGGWRKGGEGSGGEREGEEGVERMKKGGVEIGSDYLSDVSSLFMDRLVRLSPVVTVVTDCGRCSLWSLCGSGLLFPGAEMDQLDWVSDGEWMHRPVVLFCSTGVACGWRVCVPWRAISLALARKLLSVFLMSNIDC